MIWQNGKNWKAQKDNSDGIVTTGKTPKDAIEKLHAEYPVLAMCEIVYNLKKSVEPSNKVDACAVCGKSVSYHKIKKANGRTGVVVIHDGDQVPEGAVPADGVTTEYKKWLLEKVHEDSQ